MSKINLSEYVDRSESFESDPKATADRLGVPRKGDAQIKVEHSGVVPIQVNVVGVCATCGLTITSGMNATCGNKNCPTSLKSLTQSWDEYYDSSK